MTNGTYRTIRFQDETAAQLSICGGLAGAVDECQGEPTDTVGRHKTAKFEVSAVVQGAIINVGKEQWVRCVQAARAVCPTGSLSATCVGGATYGDIAFVLENPAGEL